MKRIGILLLIIALAVPASAAKSVTQFSKEIENTTNDLRELQKSIKEKRVEKEKCLLEEKTIRRELARIEGEMSRLQKKRELLRREVKRAERNLARAEKELKLAGWEKQQWQTVLMAESNAWFRANQGIEHLSLDPVSQKMREQALRQKRGFFGDAQIKEAQSRRAIGEWRAAQQKLNDLKAQHEKTIAEQVAMRGQKKELLSSTIGRRIVAEDEIKKLSESAKAFEQLIVKLQRDKKRTEEELRAQRARRAQRVQGKRENLPWPVQGAVVLAFGKNKHAELDTYVISNGIKIKTAPGAEVRCVGKGEVLYSGEFRSYGQMVIVDHGGYFSIYGQLGEIAVEEGQKLEGGQRIGTVGGAEQPVLYFEIRQENRPDDPMLWLQKR